MARKSFSYSEVLGFGWRVMRSNFWFFAGVIIVASSISFLGQISGQIITHYQKVMSSFWFFAVSGVSSIIQIILGIGLIKIALGFCDSQKPGFSTLFKGFDCFWRYIGTALLYGLIIGGTSALFIAALAFLSRSYEVLRNPLFGVPFFVVLSILLAALLIKLSLCFYFVIDKGLGPIKALRASSQATEGAKWSLFVFDILCVLINLIGMLCFFVGLFATVPTVMIAMALVYRQLSKQTSELNESGIGVPSVNPNAYGGVGGITQSFAGMQPNPIIPSIQSIQSGLCTQPVRGVQQASDTRREGKKISSNSLPGWVVASGVCVAIAAGVSYYFLVMAKGGPSKKMAISLKNTAVSLKNAAVSLKDTAVSSNKVVLKGILYSEDKPSALIGEIIAREGDTLNGVKVVKINKDTVEFEKDGQRWTQRTK